MEKYSKKKKMDMVSFHLVPMENLVLFNALNER